MEGKSSPFELKAVFPKSHLMFFKSGDVTHKVAPYINLLCLVSFFAL